MQLLSFTMGCQILTSLGMLYLVLGAVSVGVGLKTRRQPHSQLRAQVFAWWWILPVVTLSLVLHPVGASLLALLIAGLALRELMQFAGREPLLVTMLLLLLCLSISTLPLYENLPLQQRFGWLFYLYVLTALNDVAQFVSGSVFGRHRIAPGISPNKTWQGLAGGVAMTLLLSLSLGAYLNLASPLRLAVYAVLLSLGGFCGDLLFSWIKRKLGVKDFSTLIPGHGGILDRVDSLVVTAPLLYLLLRMIDES